MSTEYPAILQQLRHHKPIVLCLTNVVTMDLVANGLLALGAAPIMSLCDTELPELVMIAQAVYINIGTLDEAFIQRCHQVIAAAKQYGKPVVLDPVGAGASAIRTQTARQWLSQVDVIKGNASEVMALLDDHVITQGVESSCEPHDAVAVAQQIALKHNNTVVVTGAIDHVVSAAHRVEVKLGDAMMSRITGMGCLLGALIAAFLPIVSEHAQAAHEATQLMGQCGTQAAVKAHGPASFRSHFIDALYQAADSDCMEQGA